MKKNLALCFIAALAGLFSLWLGEVGLPALGLARIPSLLLGACHQLC